MRLAFDEGYSVQQDAPPHHCLSVRVLLQVGAAATVGLAYLHNLQPTLRYILHLGAACSAHCFLTGHTECLASLLLSHQD